MADDAIAWASLILANLCGIACAVLCLVNRPDTSLSKSRQRAGAAAVLMAASWVFGGVLSITVLAAHMPPLIVDNLAPLAIKVGVPFCGLALLLPLALVELIVGDRGYADLKSERATQKKYPVIPWT